MLVDPPGRAEVEPSADVDEPHHAQDDGLDSGQGDSLWPPGRRQDQLCTGNISVLVPKHLVGVVCFATLGHMMWRRLCSSLFSPAPAWLKVGATTL